MSTARVPNGTDKSEPVDVDDFADEILPVDGPHTREGVIAAASLIGELVRRLNHATLPGRADRSLPYPSTIDSVAGSLHRAMSLLPQTLGQLADRLNDFAEHPDLYDDRRERAEVPPGTVAAMAAFHLGEATVLAGQTAGAFADVCRQTTHLGLDTPEVES